MHTNFRITAPDFLKSPGFLGQVSYGALSYEGAGSRVTIPVVFGCLSSTRSGACVYIVSSERQQINSHYSDSCQVLNYTASMRQSKDLLPFFKKADVPTHRLFKHIILTQGLNTTRRSAHLGILWVAFRVSDSRCMAQCHGDVDGRLIAVILSAFY